MQTLTVMKAEGLQLVKTDDQDKDISPRGINLCAQVAAFYPVCERVDIYETIHGHIAAFAKKPGSFVPGQEGKPARMNAEDMQFFANLEGLRWFEATTGTITVSFEN
ncbi:hypothetical protein [Gilvimarinus chinensis]|uniref:hypothetical protein n=1 Tax=Gilvimarinus chinensis TaxID=396005 RepID=UPI00036FFFB3|nr:hypothetical protein [Gilvimarinus chinensis]